MMKKKLPVGIESFEKIRTQGFYYVDKTNLIADLLRNWGEVNLFTRPRRFGKSLNMSMLKCFFEIGCDKKLFDGLHISDERELCEEYMGRFPVISISLKGVSGKDVTQAKDMLCSAIGNEALRFLYLLESSKMSEQEKILYRQLITVDQKGQRVFNMSDAALADSLLTLSRLLRKHFGQKVIILIDEYDVPLDKAYQMGYYDDMVLMLRNLFTQALKSNESLQFAVLTGCMRISKESIFTGLNNLKVLSIMNVQFDEYFGFTDWEVQELLSFYDLSFCYDTVREWYDGYRFGSVQVYCPWDVISYCDDLQANPAVKPMDYWSNTSGNDIVKRFLCRAKRNTKQEIERLIDGESIRKTIRQELTYKDLEGSIDNLWSMLFTTGYLTQCGEAVGNEVCLTIPNKEIHKIFTTQIREWFHEMAASDGARLDVFCKGFREGDSALVEEMFNAYLMKTISIRDTCVQKERKENFYHGILLGLLSHMEDWSISSNAESGDGYSDILVELEEERIGIVAEIKYAEKDALEEGCRKALQQIEEKKYAQALKMDGMKKILKYGIACYKKHCRVDVRKT